MKRRALLLALPLAIGWAQPQPEFEVASVKPWTPPAGPFAINLGVVTKIHRRTAIVAHVSKGGTGLMMESLTGTR